MYDYLPGGEILSHGLRDLQAGVRSADALLVLVAAPDWPAAEYRFRKIGSPSELPEHDLFRQLSVEHGL